MGVEKLGLGFGVSFSLVGLFCGIFVENLYRLFVKLRFEFVLDFSLVVVSAYILEFFLVKFFVRCIFRYYFDFRFFCESESVELLS